VEKIRALKVRGERLCAPSARIGKMVAVIQTFHVWLPSRRRYRGANTAPLCGEETPTEQNRQARRMGFCSSLTGGARRCEIHLQRGY